MLIALLVFAAGYFLLYYISDQARPADMFNWFFGYSDRTLYPEGWWGFYDQSQYLGMAKAMADFNSTALQSVYTYGLGYPIVAVPAILLGFTKDPFVFFNLGVFLFAVLAVYKAGQRFFSPTAGLLAGFGLAFATPLLVYTAQPWNSTVCLLAMSGMLLIASQKNITWKHALFGGFLVGWAFAARYVDVIWFAPILLAALYRGNLKQLAKYGGVAAIGGLIWLAPVLYSHNHFFGSPLRTPYVNHLGLNDESSDQALGSYKLSRVESAFKGMMLGPRIAESDDTDKGFFASAFWILAAIPGLILVFRRKNHRIFFGTLMAVTFAGWLFYLSFRASTPESLKFGILHYFKMFWPGLVLLAAAFFDSQLQHTIESRNTHKKEKSQRTKPKIA